MGRNKTKTGRSLNPADAYRKQLRQKELKKNKIQKQKVRTLILQTKTSSKIQDQIDEISRLEDAGDMDKRHKVKKKILQDTLSKVLELEKLKGDNLQEEDLLSIPNYIDFTQGPITLSDKPRTTETKPKPTMTTFPPVRPNLNINTFNGLPSPPTGPAPFDLPPPPEEPLPGIDQPPLPQEDYQPPLPDGPAPQFNNFPSYGTGNSFGFTPNPMMNNVNNNNNNNFNNVNNQWRNPNMPPYGGPQPYQVNQPPPPQYPPQLQYPPQQYQHQQQQQQQQ